jgi:plastocyanin
MNESTRERALFPLATPLLIFAVMGGLVFLFSRILLNVPRPVAVAVALLTGVNIIVTCAVVSIRRIQGFAVFLLLLVIAIPVVLGGAAATNAITVHVTATKAPPPPPVAISANNLAFSTKTLNLPAGTATIDFKNADTAPHNIEIFDGSDATAPSLFKGTVATPGTSVVYTVPGLKPGTYFFHCDIHPTLMTGTVVVTAAGSKSSSSYGGSGSSASSAGSTFSGSALSITAANISFNTKTLTVPANAAATLTLDNKDTQPHNFDIISGPAGYTKPAAFPTVTQPGGTTTYNIPALPAGTYQFRCDIHPTQMTGTLTVQ